MRNASLQQQRPDRAGVGHHVLLALAATLLLVLPSWAQSGSVLNPRRLAPGPTGQILVSDRSHLAVMAVDMETLEPVWSFTFPEEGSPFGLATTRKLVFVGNTTTNNVEVYKMVSSHRDPLQPVTLEFQYNLGFTQPGQPGLFSNPVSIAVDTKKNRVFVLDSAEKKIKVFDVKGKMLDVFAPVDSQGLVLSPVAITVDSRRQELLVSDYGDPGGFFRTARLGRILIYSTDGELISQINGDGTTNSTTRFVRPQGLRVDRWGRIYVAEALANRILVLDRNTGAKLAEVGSSGAEPGQLLGPLDVLIDSRTGDLFVADVGGARRVEVFRGAGR